MRSARPLPAVLLLLAAAAVVAAPSSLELRNAKAATIANAFIMPGGRETVIANP